MAPVPLCLLRTNQCSVPGRWEIPKVRFTYEVSPPPPPPAELTLYQQLSEEDPAGFELARSKLEELLPTLSMVATSSVGASVGQFLADVHVTQQQLTRAFLASKQFEKDSIGARWVEGQHTNTWRRVTPHARFASATRHMLIAIFVSADLPRDRALPDRRDAAPRCRKRCARLCARRRGRLQRRF